jgi:hypothetical protein
MYNDKDNFNLLGLDFENISNTSSSFTSICLWILNKANLFKWFSPIVVLKYVFMRFSVEKDCSLVNVVTGNIAKLVKVDKCLEILISL